MIASGPFAMGPSQGEHLPREVCYTIFTPKYLPQPIALVEQVVQHHTTTLRLRDLKLTFNVIANPSIQPKEKNTQTKKLKMVVWRSLIWSLFLRNWERVLPLA